VCSDCSACVFRGLLFSESGEDASVNAQLIF